MDETAAILRDTKRSVSDVSSILISDQDFFEILLNQSKEHKNYSIYVVEVFFLVIDLDDHFKDLRCTVR